MGYPGLPQGHAGHAGRACIPHQGSHPVLEAMSETSPSGVFLINISGISPWQMYVNTIDIYI